MNMRVLRKERIGEATGFYTQEAGDFGVCRQVQVGVSPRDRTRSQPYSGSEGS